MTNEQAKSITLTTNEAGFIATAMTINKTENKKYVKVGDV